MVYLGWPRGKISREGVSHQPAHPVTYSSSKFDQAATCFEYTRKGLLLMMLGINVQSN